MTIVVFVTIKGLNVKVLRFQFLLVNYKTILNQESDNYKKMLHLLGPCNRTGTSGSNLKYIMHRLNETYWGVINFWSVLLLWAVEIG